MRYIKHALKMKFQSIAYLFNGSEHIYIYIDIYRILDLEGEVHSIWDLWISGLQECKGNGFFQSRVGGSKFSVGSRKFGFLSGGCPSPNFYLPRKARRGGLTSAIKYPHEPQPTSFIYFRIIYGSVQLEVYKWCHFWHHCLKATSQVTLKNRHMMSILYGLWNL